MQKIGTKFLGKRVVGAPETSMRLLSMWLIKKSRKVMFVNSLFRDKWISFLKERDNLKKLHNDDKDVYAASMHDRYAARPNHLEHLCLAKCTVNYASI